MLVLPSSTHPASRTRAAGGESAAAGVMLSPAAVPSGVGTPLDAMLSLIVIGTPSIGLSGAPSRQRRSELVACANAPTASVTYIALIFGSQASMRSSTARVTSTGDNWRVR